MSIAMKAPIIGTNTSDRLAGRAVDELISARQGDDTVTANAGEDIVYGGRGNDLLAGDAGSDVLYGGGNGPSFARLDRLEIVEDFKGTVTFEGETAGYRNTLGWYKVVDGKITAVEVLWQNASLKGSGGDLTAGVDAKTLSLQAGDQLGFFIVSDGFSQNNFSKLVGGHYEFRDASGAVATLGSSNPRLWYVDANGAATLVKGDPYHTAAYDKTLPLNNDGILHTVGQVDIAAGTVRLGFEDLRGGGDRDFDDSVFTVNIGQANVQVLNAHGALGGADGTPAGLSEAGPAKPYVEGTENDTISGGDGNDAIHGRAGHDRLAGDAGDDVIYGGSGNDIASGGAGNDQLFGGDGQDQLNGDAGNDKLYGGAGSDSAWGGIGNDMLDGGSGADTLLGGDGADQIVGGADNDLLQGDAGNDTLSGESGDDTLHGGTGDDTLDGGTGADTLIGGDGIDRLLGGAGNDWFQSGSGRDFLSGGAGVDTVSYEGAASGVTVSLSAGTTTGGDSDSLDGIENVLGSKFADKLTGDNGENVLVGGDGNDILTGREGRDTLWGNDGADTFVFRSADLKSGPDLIADFVAGQDTIDVSGIVRDFKLSGENAKEWLTFERLDDGLHVSIDIDGIEVASSPMEVAIILSSEKEMLELSMDAFRF